MSNAASADARTGTPARRAVNLEVKLATVNVSDYERAIDFYVNTLGFTPTTDAPYGEGMRWIEVTPPGGTTSLVLHKPHPPHGGQPGQTHNILFDTDDLEATCRELRARGVRITMEPHHDPPAPPLAQIADPDGNTFIISQRGQ